MTITARILALLLLAGCAARDVPEIVANPYGFLWGIWHGIAAPWAVVANIVSWFASLAGISVFENVHVIGTPNTGWPYYAGFFVGLSSYGAAGTGARRPRRRPPPPPPPPPSRKR